ncbi:MAG: endonuclease [Muribaculaceae bacterium]|nr:endonuclease [Muribaculaceae bacterium]
MKKIYVALTLAVLCIAPASAEFKAGYYDKMNGKSAAALKAAAKECVLKHQTLEYYELPNYWQYSDVYPELVDGCKRWWDMYSDAVYLIRNGQSGKSSFSANKMQREHSVPKSWWKLNGSVEYTPAYSDMWNLYPSDGAANQAKLNYPLGIAASTTFNNGVTKVGGAQTGYGGGSRYVFEPADEYKGDFARAYMYVATVYDDVNWVVNYMYKKESYPTLQPWAREMLLQWCRQDPVDQKEIDRNNVVEQYQGNRNPFVDFPELAEYIWGIRTTETFYVNEQAGSDPTPPITGDPEITAPVNGESLDFGQVAQGRSETRVLQIVGKNLTSPLSVRVTGTDRAMFVPEITKEIPASTINQNQGYLLNITYTPTSVGEHEARIVLYDGGLTGSIAVTLQGEALPMPTFTTLTAIEPTDLTANSYTARWNPVGADEIADYYLLTRTRLMNGEQETDTYETGETSYAINDRDASVAEIYYVQYSRLGILSEPSNEIYVAAGSNVEELYHNSPLQIFAIDGGFTVRTTSASNAPLHVYDINGIEVLTIETPVDGSEYSLPAGIYVLTSGNLRPFKLIVL